MLVSKKLRAGILLAFVNLVAIKAPATRVALPREALEFLNTALGIVAAGQLLQVVANELVEALPQSIRFFARASDQLLVHRKSHIHVHTIRVHMYRVNSRMSLSSRVP